MPTAGQYTTEVTRLHARLDAIEAQLERLQAGQPWPTHHVMESSIRRIRIRRDADAILHGMLTRLFGGPRMDTIGANAETISKWKQGWNRMHALIGAGAVVCE